MVKILEEIAVNAVISYLTATLPAALASIERDYPGVLLPMYVKMDDEYMDPQDVATFPYASVFVDDSKDKVQDRALDENLCRVRVMTLVKGKRATKKTYRYNAAIREMIQGNRTLGAPNLRARVLERVYYTPIMRGDEEVRVAETYLEITMEVQRR